MAWRYWRGTWVEIQERLVAKGVLGRCSLEIFGGRGRFKID